MLLIPMGCRSVAEGFEHLIIPQAFRNREGRRVIGRFNTDYVDPEPAPGFDSFEIVPFDKPGAPETVVAFDAEFVDLDPEQDMDHL